MNLKVTMVGDKAVAKALNRLGSNLSGKMMVKAVVSGSWILLNRMKQLAPYLTGTLRRSLHIGGQPGFSPGQSPTGQSYSDIGGQVVTADRVGVETGTNLVYAAIQEFGGTIKRTSTLGKSYTIQIPPTAYMRGAYLEKKIDVIQEIDLALDVMIRNALK